MNAKWICILGGAATALWPALSGAECRAASPNHTVALIELYTSEGCDSCPPADRWLSALNLGAPATRAVALAFHVDYWDRLGWRDRFGSATFTERQYEQMGRRHAAFVYTPQVLLQGTEFSRWHDAGQPIAALATINARPARATIELVAQPVDGSTAAVDLYVRVPHIRDRTHAAVVVALTQSGLANDVKAGENAGKRLVHDHVVRAWHAGAPIGVAGELRQHFNLPLPTNRGPLQIVAFAENTATGDVLQALALPVCTR
jgi:hypothetical protein